MFVWVGTTANVNMRMVTVLELFRWRQASVRVRDRCQLAGNKPKHNESGNDPAKHHFTHMTTTLSLRHTITGDNGKQFGLCAGVYTESQFSLPPPRAVEIGLAIRIQPAS